LNVTYLAFFLKIVLKTKFEKSNNMSNIQKRGIKVNREQPAIIKRGNHGRAKTWIISG
jgi:hypothetical protein